MMYQMGVYCRLSKDDGENKVSESIENQMKLIREYVTKSEDLEIADIYIDDGYSGRVRAMMARCSSPIGMKKRPDSKKPFERKKYGIQLYFDNFRAACQTRPVRWPGFFVDSANIV